MTRSAGGFGDASPSRRDPPGEEFDEFFGDTYPLLVKLALLAGSTIEAAEDAANETMTDILRRWPTIEDRRAYACRSVKNLVARTMKRERQLLPRAVRAQGSQPSAGDDGGLGECEDREWVVHLLKELPPRQREVMSCYFDGLTPQEIALALSQDAVNVRKNLSLARASLKDLLRQQHDQPAIEPSTIRRPRGEAQ